MFVTQLNSDLSGKLDVEQNAGIQNIGWEVSPVAAPYLMVDGTKLMIPVASGSRFAVTRMIVDTDSANNFGVKFTYYADGQIKIGFIPFAK